MTPSIDQITLRDFFAVFAMQAYMQDWKPEFAAKLAYEMADAMLKAREQ